MKQKGKSRASSQQILERYDRLLQLKAQGFTKGQLFQICRGAWELSERQTFRYLAEVDALEAGLAQGEPLSHYGILLNRARHQYAKADRQDNIPLAIKATELESSIYEKIAKEKRRETTASIHTAPLNDQEILEIIQSLEDAGKVE